MRTRNYDYLDTRRNVPMYGFQVRRDGQWVNAAENGTPCIYKTKAERDSKKTEFRKIKEK